MPRLGVDIIDEFPLICRKRENKEELVISLMVDSGQKSFSFALHGHSFISFVTYDEPGSVAGMIKFLATRNNSRELVCATLKFAKPFESLMTDITMW